MATLNPYLSFRNEARAAMRFYQDVFDGDLQITTFGEFEGMVQHPDERELVMHAQLTTPDGFVLMASDTPSGMHYAAPAGVAVAISGDDLAQLQRYWDALAAEGTVNLPYETPPWGGRFGMLTDRFGIDWMISLNAQG